MQYPRFRLVLILSLSTLLGAQHAHAQPLPPDPIQTLKDVPSPEDVHRDADKLPGLGLLQSQEIAVSVIALSPEGPILVEHGAVTGILPLTLTLRVASADGSFITRTFSRDHWEIAGYHPIYSLVSLRLKDSSIRLQPIEKSTVVPTTNLPCAIVGYRNQPDHSGARCIPTTVTFLRNAPTENGGKPVPYLAALKRQSKQPMAGSAVTDPDGKVLGILTETRGSDAIRYEEFATLEQIQRNPFTPDMPPDASRREPDLGRFIDGDPRTLHSEVPAHTLPLTAYWGRFLLEYGRRSESPKMALHLAANAAIWLPPDLASQYVALASSKAPGQKLPSAFRPQWVTSPEHGRPAVYIFQLVEQGAIENALAVFMADWSARAAIPKGDTNARDNLKYQLNALNQGLRANGRVFEAAYLAAWANAEGFDASQPSNAKLPSAINADLSRSGREFSLEDMQRLNVLYKTITLQSPVLAPAAPVHPSDYVSLTAPQTIDFPAPVQSIAFARQDRTLVVLVENAAALQTINLNTLKPLGEQKLDRITPLSASAQGNQVFLVRPSSGSLAVVDLDSGAASTKKIDQTLPRTVLLTARQDYPHLLFFTAWSDKTRPPTLTVYDVETQATWQPGVASFSALPKGGDRAVFAALASPLANPAETRYDIIGSRLSLVVASAPVPGAVKIIDPCTQTELGASQLGFAPAPDPYKQVLLASAFSDRIVAIGPKPNQVTIAPLGLNRNALTSLAPHTVKPGQSWRCQTQIDSADLCTVLEGPDGFSFSGGVAMWQVSPYQLPGVVQALIAATPPGKTQTRYIRFTLEVIK